MIHVFKRAWTDTVSPWFFKTKRPQVAALCYRRAGDGWQVLLITSRGTGRWILPKGWPMKGKSDAQAALQEAWEEAGVKRADILDEPIGYYDYMKGLKTGEQVPVEASVFLTRVRDMSSDYPEEDERSRAWFPPEIAATLVDEPDLQDILREFAQRGPQIAAA